jgi:hypothetical protein
MSINLDYPWEDILCKIGQDIQRPILIWRLYNIFSAGTMLS